MADNTPPTMLSPAALTRGWKLIAFLIAAAFLTPIAQMEAHACDASQRRIWFLGDQARWKSSGAEKGTCVSLPPPLIQQCGGCSASTGQRDESRATKTWTHQSYWVGAAGYPCPSCCQGSLTWHPPCAPATDLALVGQPHPFLGLNLPDQFHTPEQHSSECTYPI